MRYKRGKPFVILAALLAASAPTNAQNEIDYFKLSLEELLKTQIVMAASGYEQKIEYAPVTVSILQREEWEALGATTLYEAIETIAGVHLVYETLGIGRQTIRLRGVGGENGHQVKLLINGMPFEDRQNGGQLTGGVIPLTGFKRIEVIKGPGSVVYGADAFAGVVNLVTEDTGESNNNNVQMRVGSDNHRTLNASHGGSVGDFTWYLAAEHSEQDKGDRLIEQDRMTGFDLADFSQLTPPASLAPGFIDDNYELTSVLVKAKYKALEIEHFNWRNKTGNQLGIANSLDPRGRTEYQHQTTRLSYDISQSSRIIPGTLTAEVTIENQTRNNLVHAFPPGSVVLVGDDGNLFQPPRRPAIFTEGTVGNIAYEADTMGLKLNHVFEYTLKHGIRWEVGYEKIDFIFPIARNFGPGVLDVDTAPRPPENELWLIDGTVTPVGSALSILPDGDRNLWFASIQDEWKIRKDVTLALGVRHDEYSDFDSSTNPRVGVNWQATDRLKLKFFSGTSFRAPAFNELSLQNNPNGNGNPDLEPETIASYELGGHYDLSDISNLTLSGSIFHFETKNIIRFIAGTNALPQTENTEGTNGIGVEFDFRWKPREDLSLSANFTLQEQENNTGITVHNTPSTLAFLGINWRILDNVN